MNPFPLIYKESDKKQPQDNTLKETGFIPRKKQDHYIFYTRFLTSY